MNNCTNKKCSQINPQPSKNFSKCKSRKSGLTAQCKICRSTRWHEQEKLKIPVGLIKKQKRDADILNGIKCCNNEKCPIVNPQPFANFYARKGGYDGYQNYCKICSSKHHKEFLQIPETKADILEYNREYVKKRSKEDPEFLVKKAEYNKVYRIDYDAKPENKAKKLERAIKRRAHMVLATPKWLTDEQKEQISAIYRECAIITAETGIPHEVDHIVPVKGKTVRGLHVPWNLRIITAKENLKKRNKLILELLNNP